jgi:dipeptidyl aminopeptidase/acylaminoacyl peptidase
MTEHRTVDERISMWLEEEAQGQLPDRVLEAAFDRTRVIRHRPGPSAWRPYTMSRQISALIAVGAAAIIIVVGFNALRPPTAPAVVGATPLPSVAPTAVPPTSAPTIAATTKPLGLAIVELDGTIRVDLGLPHSAWAASLAPDGSRLAFVDRGKIWISGVGFAAVPTDSGVSVTGRIGMFGTFPADAALAWSPDGNRLAYASDGDIYVLTVGGADPPRRLSNDPKLDEWPAWSPDGRFIYYINEGATPLDDNAISTSQELWRVPARGGTPKRITRDESAQLQPDFAHDGSMLIWQDGGVTAMDATDGRSTELRNTGDGAVIDLGNAWNPRISPDGSKIAVLSYQGDRATPVDSSLGIPDGIAAMEVVVIERKTGAVTTVGPRVVAFWNPVSWTPDSQALLINRFDDGS